MQLVQLRRRRRAADLRRYAVQFIHNIIMPRTRTQSKRKVLNRKQPIECPFWQEQDTVWYRRYCQYSRRKKCNKYLTWSEYFDQKYLKNIDINVTIPLRCENEIDFYLNTCDKLLCSDIQHQHKHNIM